MCQASRRRRQGRRTSAHVGSGKRIADQGAHPLEDGTADAPRSHDSRSTNGVRVVLWMPVDARRTWSCRTLLALGGPSTRPTCPAYVGGPLPLPRLTTHLTSLLACQSGAANHLPVLLAIGQCHAGAGGDGHQNQVRRLQRAGVERRSALAVVSPPAAVCPGVFSSWAVRIGWMLPAGRLSAPHDRLRATTNSVGPTKAAISDGAGNPTCTIGE